MIESKFGAGRAGKKSKKKIVGVAAASLAAASIATGILINRKDETRDKGKITGVQNKSDIKRPTSGFKVAPTEVGSKEDKAVEPLDEIPNIDIPEIPPSIFEQAENVFDEFRRDLESFFGKPIYDIRPDEDRKIGDMVFL